ncbi:hypothetical protein GGX14DRAFT_490652, partial [Mycena pura]
MAEDDTQLFSETVSTLSTTGVPPHWDVTIEFLPASATEDDSLVARLTHIVNVAYDTTESDLFGDGYQRTSQDEVCRLIRAGELAVAYINASPSSTSEAQKAVGCIRIMRSSDTKGALGMVALDAMYHGGGIGRDLVLFAQDHCRRRGMTVMQLELLVPTWFEHKFKKRLLEWYSRMGYELVGVGQLSDIYPSLASLLKGQCELRIYEKSLV